MQTLILKIQKFEFEARIFISFGIVIILCGLSFLVYASVPANFVIISGWMGIESELSLRVGYFVVAALMVISSTLRMWAGSVLTSQRMMAFKIQKDKLATSGPYLLVRNPIYLADLIAFCGFALCLKPIGAPLPVLLFLHYTQLVKYEERSLKERFGDQFQAYMAAAPRFLPDFRSAGRFLAAAKDFRVNLDGFRHNALYLLFIPGFVVTAITGSLTLAVLIGLPAVIDWTIVHIRKGLAPGHSDREKALSRLYRNGKPRKKVFEDILYAQCWEDSGIDREAFKIGPDDVVFSITSGGCNILAFLLDNPRKIIALDVNPYQNYLLDLKMAAFKSLGYEELLEFLGVAQSVRRPELYTSVRSGLDPDSRDWWDKQLGKIDRGVIHCGRYEGYMHLLRRWFCLLMGRSLVEKLFAADNEAERAAVYRDKWDNVRWRFFTQLLLSRAVMTLLFDRAFFAQLEDSFSFGDHFRGLVKRGVLELPLKDNYFISYILLGRYYSREHLPVYLRRENFEVIRTRLERIELVYESCEDYFTTLPADYISKFNFTNIFEWMPPDTFEQILRETVRVAKDGAVITYRNLLVPRSRPDTLAEWIEPQKQLSDLLHKRDLSFIYKAYIVERINKEKP